MIVSINERECKVPQSWNELLLTELLTLFQLLNSQAPGFIFAKEELPLFLRIEAGKYLLQIDDAFLHKWKADCLAAYPDGGDLIFQQELWETVQSITGFLFTPNNEIQLQLTRNPYPRIGYTKGKKKAYLYGPKDGLSNITIYELGTSFTLFENYLKTKEERFLNKLLAILYRPAKKKSKANKRSAYQGDRRLPYYQHEATVDQRLPLIRKWPPLLKGILLFWFASCRQEIIDGYPNIFKSNAPKLEKIGNDYGWGGILMSLAGGIVNLESVSNQNYQNGLAYLSFLEDERKKAEFRQARAAQ